MKKFTFTLNLITVSKVNPNRSILSIYLVMNVQDRRRILGPSAAKPLAFNSKNRESNIPNELANPKIQTGLISNCNGSCIIETTNISLLSSVYGPRSTRTVSFESRCELNVVLKSDKFETNALKELSFFIVSVLESCICLEKYPKAGIDIFVNFNIEDVDSLSYYLPYILMSIILSVVDSGIEITDLVGGCYVEGNVICFSQNGREVVGFWNDESDINLDNFDKLVETGKTQYLSIKQQMVDYLSSL